MSTLNPASAYGNQSNFAFSEGIFTTEPWQLFLATLLTVVLTACASVSGIGGGGLVVPIIAYVLNTGVYYAAPISAPCMFGVGVGKNIISAQRRHPILVRPLIHYDLANISQTMMVLGTMFGVMLHTLLPEVVIVIVLVVVLGWSGTECMMDGMEKYHHETHLKQAADEERLAKLAETEGGADVDEAIIKDSAELGTDGIELAVVTGRKASTSSESDEQPASEKTATAKYSSNLNNAEVEGAPVKPASGDGEVVVDVEAQGEASSSSSTEQGEAAAITVATPAAGEAKAPADKPKPTKEELEALDMERFRLKFPVPEGKSEHDLKTEDLVRCCYCCGCGAKLGAPSGRRPSKSAERGGNHAHVDNQQTLPVCLPSPSVWRPHLLLFVQIVTLFHHERRCFWWETWLSGAVLSAYLIVYALVKSEAIYIWDTCSISWIVWCVVPSFCASLRCRDL
jgi:hypothetical protein